MQGFAERADEGGLAQAGDAFEQAVAAYEEAGEHAVDDFGMADDGLGDFSLHGAIVAPEGIAGGLDLGIDAGDGELGHGGLSYFLFFSRNQPEIRNQKPEIRIN